MGPGDFFDPPHGLPRKIFVHLQICHLNNSPGDDRDDNLRAYGIAERIPDRMDRAIARRPDFES